MTPHLAPTRPSLALLATLTLCLAAGCMTFGGGTATPGPDETQTVDLTLSNEDSVTYAVQLSIVPDPDATVTLTFANGTAVTTDQQGLLGESPAARDSVTAIEFAGEGVQTERYRLQPNTGIGDTVERVPRGADLWLIVFSTDDDGELQSWGQSSCRPQTDRIALDLVVTGDGSMGLGTVCESR